MGSRRRLAVDDTLRQASMLRMFHQDPSPLKTLINFPQASSLETSRHHPPPSKWRESGCRSRARASTDAKDSYRGFGTP
jgi:hypothetical protein